MSKHGFTPLVEHAWNMHGICMEYECDVYGICMEYAWNMYGIRKGYVWNMHGICMEYARNMRGMRGICLEYVWNVLVNEVPTLNFIDPSRGICWHPWTTQDCCLRPKAQEGPKSPNECLTKAMSQHLASFCPDLCPSMG